MLTQNIVDIVANENDKKNMAICKDSSEKSAKSSYILGYKQISVDIAVNRSNVLTTTFDYQHTSSWKKHNWIHDRKRLMNPKHGKQPLDMVAVSHDEWKRGC